MLLRAPCMCALQAFTWYEYMPSEYDRGRLMGKFEKLKGKLAQVSQSWQLLDMQMYSSASRDLHRTSFGCMGCCTHHQFLAVQQHSETVATGR